jgi:RNA polymerase sigma-70 factor, ECF subfamily
LSAVSVSQDESRRVAHWIEAARGGSDLALGQLLELCRPYLLLVANAHLDPDLRARVGASDLVDETVLEAQGHFACFPGSTEIELLAWLRRMVINNATKYGQQFRPTQTQQLDREVSLPDTGQVELPNAAMAQGGSPSCQRRAPEQDEALRRALAQLPEQYQQVIRWRNYERSSFEELARRLGRSPEAVRELWAQAIDELQQLLELYDDSQ